MLKRNELKICAFLSLIIILFGTNTLVIAANNKSDKLIIDNVTFTSSIYQDIKVTDFVENFPGELDIKIRNDEASPSPEAVLSVQLQYDYPRTNPSGVVNPPSFLKDSLQLGRKELPSINSKDTIQIKLKTGSIDLKGPPVNNAVKLSIQIYDLNNPSNVLYSKIYKTYSLVTETDIKGKPSKKEEDNIFGLSNMNFVIFAISFLLLIILLTLVMWIIKSQQMQREELKLQREELKTNREKANRASAKENEYTEAYGPGSGGYIIIDLPNNQKSLFHDVLKGFEEYAQSRGYQIQFSVDSTLSDKIAFKFTLTDTGVTVSTKQVKRDLQDYIQRVQRGDPLDDLPIVLPEPEHQALLLAMKNRIAFLQNTYLVQRNAIQFYEDMMKRISTLNFGIVPNQNFYLQTGGNMGNSNYSNVNSPGSVQGANNLVTGNTMGENINIGVSANDRKKQADLIQELIQQLHDSDSIGSDIEVDAKKYLDKVKDEILEEEKPDPNRIAKWLDKAKSFLGTIGKAGELYDKAKEVFASFNLSF